MPAVASAIPVLPLRPPSDHDFVAALSDSFRTYGFAVISDHGIAPSLIRHAWTLAHAFFALPDSAKRGYRIPGGAGQRGYTAFATEIAKNAGRPDLKEFWHVGREAESGVALPDGMPANIWPVEIPDFRECFSALYTGFEQAGAKLLAAIAAGLGLSPDWFEAPTMQGNSILRLLHYPPVDNAASAPGAVRAAAHEDINLITLLLGAEEAGLQLLTREGEWLDIRPPEDALVVNIGDMLQRLTNGVLPSTTHRVVNPSSERAAISRYSMPFFLHLRPDFLIDTLPGCVSEGNPLRYLPISAQDYLEERLCEIGLLPA